MRRRPLALLFAIVCASAAASAGDSPVIARVGDTTLRADAVEAQLRSMPTFQLRTFGTDPKAVARHVTEEFLVPNVLFARAARERKMSERPAVRARLDDALSRALQRRVAEDLRRNEPVTDEAIAAYYAEHRREFVKPERLRLWRILVSDRKAAEQVLQSAKGSGDPAKWNQLARQHSLDQATRMRGGDLGFVEPDGHTEKPQVRVDPALYEAASQVADGAIVPNLVKEGERFAVVWRRGTLDATEQSVADAAPAIRQVLERQRVTQRLEQLVERLRKEQLNEVHPELLDDLDVPEPRPAGSAPKTPAPHRSADPDPQGQGADLR